MTDFLVGRRWYQGGIDFGQGQASAAQVDCNEIWRALDVRDEDVRGKRVLDICCNEGFFALKAASLGAARVTAFDQELDYLEAAREVQRRMGFDQIDFLHLPYALVPWKEWAPFHTTFFLRAIYHLQEGVESLRQACDMTQETLFLMVMLWSFPNPEHLGLKGWEHQRWRYIPTFEQLEADLAACSFVIEHVDALHSQQLLDCGLVPGGNKIQTAHRIAIRARRTLT